MTQDEVDSTSDNDNERPVREKLKKASLGTLPKHGLAPEDEVDPDEDKNVGAPIESLVEQSPVAHKVENREENGTVTKGGGSAVAAKAEDVEEARPAVPLLSEQQQPGEATGEPQEGRPESHRDEARLPNAALTEKGSQEDPQTHVISDGASSDLKPIPHSPPSAASLPADSKMEDVKDRIASPKKKRSRDQFDKDHDKGEELTRVESEEERRHSAETERGPNAANRTSRTIRDEPEKKRYRDASQEAEAEDTKEETKIPPTTGFSNSSTISPFAALASSKSHDTSSTASASDKPQTSSSAFAASGFGALSASATSPFGTLGAPDSGKSPFGAFGASKPATSGFGALGEGKASTASSAFGGVTTTSSSAFGSGTSGFAKLGGGLGSTFGGLGGGSSSFGSKSGSGIVGLSDKPVKAFGAPEGDDEGDDDDDDEDDDGEDADDDNQEKTRQASEDRRYQQHEVETGEEGEETVFSGQAKLYHMTRGDNAAEHGWKERGVGLLKVNVPMPILDESEETSESEAGTREDERASKHTTKRTARLLMRASGVYRVILNVPIYKGMKLLSPEGDVPTSTKSSKSLMLTILEDGKPVMLQIKFRESTSALDLYKQVAEVQQGL